MHGHKLTIYAAIAANAAIAVTKFVAAGATGSGAMFSEGIHSVVDTGDGLLVLLGLYLSRKPPDDRHPYGHGLEVYFWSMVVAMAIFGAGGGVSIYEGIHNLGGGHALELSVWTYVVLGIAFAFEGTSWGIAVRSFQHARRGRGVWQTISRSKDPTSFIVLLEDSAALAGLLIAAIGVTLAHWLEAPALDAIASIAIGVLLCVVAAILGHETWSLLLGESASPEIVESIRSLAAEQPGVVAVQAPRTMHIGPETVHVDLDVELDASGTAGDVVETARRIENAVRAQHPLVKRVSLRFPKAMPA